MSPPSQDPPNRLDAPGAPGRSLEVRAGRHLLHDDGDREPLITFEPYAGEDRPTFRRLDEAMMAAHRHPFGPADPPSGGTFRRVGMTASRPPSLTASRLPSRVSRRRESHGRQRGHRRARATRAGPGEPGPDEPALGRHPSEAVR